MFFVLLPVIQVEFSQFFGFKDQKVFSVSFLGRPGEVEGPGNNRLPVDDHNLIMGNSMGRIDIGWNPDVGQKIGRSILFPLLALVHNNLDIYSPFVGREHSFSYREGGKGIGLNQDFGLGPVYLLDNGLSTPPVGAEIDLGGGVGQGQVEWVGRGRVD